MFLCLQDRRRSGPGRRRQASDLSEEHDAVESASGGSAAAMNLQPVLVPCTGIPLRRAVHGQPHGTSAAACTQRCQQQEQWAEAEAHQQQQACMVCLGPA